ncbi:unnamed protein product [Rotaria sp. Silwood1]|nr:unnamed protein product [Rotaria sp. Silwood1]
MNRTTQHAQLCDDWHMKTLHIQVREEKSLFILLIDLFFFFLCLEEKSLFDDNDLQLFVKPRIERRFCCMSPLLSGRKRSIRDLTKKQIESQQT